jgi:TRAP-type C4-dicarboxylate transport system permease small subunit
MIKHIEKANIFFNKILICIAGVVLICMMMLACANVFLRSVWLPVRGTFEIMGFLGAITASFALGYTQIRREHIAIDVIISRFSKKTRMLLNGINYVIGSVFFIVMAWQSVVRGMTLSRVNELSETLRMPYFPFMYGVAVGCLAIAAVMLIDTIKYIFPPDDPSKE